jgi:hypothetical protein
MWPPVAKALALAPRRIGICGDRRPSRTRADRGVGDRPLQSFDPYTIGSRPLDRYLSYYSRAELPGNSRIAWTDRTTRSATAECEALSMVSSGLFVPSDAKMLVIGAFNNGETAIAQRILTRDTAARPDRTTLNDSSREDTGAERTRDSAALHRYPCRPGPTTRPL